MGHFVSMWLKHIYERIVHADVVTMPLHVETKIRLWPLNFELVSDVFIPKIFLSSCIAWCAFVSFLSCLAPSAAPNHDFLAIAGFSQVSELCKTKEALCHFFLIQKKNSRIDSVRLSLRIYKERLTNV